MTLADYSRSRRCALATASRHAKALGFVRARGRYDVDAGALDEQRSKVHPGRPRILTDDQRAERIIPARLRLAIARRTLLVDRDELMRLVANELKRRAGRRHERRSA